MYADIMGLDPACLGNDPKTAVVYREVLPMLLYIKGVPGDKAKTRLGALRRKAVELGMAPFTLRPAAPDADYRVG